MDPTIKLGLEGLLAAVCASAVHLLNDNNTRLRIGLPNWGRYLLAAVFGVLGAALVADTANPGTFVPALVAAATVAMPAVMVILLDARTDTSGSPLQSKRPGKPPSVPPVAGVLLLLVVLTSCSGNAKQDAATAASVAQRIDDAIRAICGTDMPFVECERSVANLFGQRVALKYQRPTTDGGVK